MRRSRQDPSLEAVLTGFLALIIFGGSYKLYQQFQTNRIIFLVELVGLLALIALGVGVVLWLKRRAEGKKRGLITKISKNGLEPEIKNFITRFGIEKKRKNNWGFREHYFTWDRLEDFRKILQEHGIPVSSNKWEDTLFILRHFIQMQERGVTDNSVKISTKLFADLSGQDFENLLYRLFIARDYSVQRTGKPGDQGADLIANKGNERIVIQAKRYEGSVGNSAVQEAVAAQKLYDCNKASVITTSGFTNEARTLAKANGVELIEKAQLQKLLLQFLKESWV